MTCQPTVTAIVTELAHPGDHDLPGPGVTRDRRCQCICLTTVLRGSSLSPAKFKAHGLAWRHGGPWHSGPDPRTAYAGGPGLGPQPEVGYMTGTRMFLRRWRQRRGAA